ncbi:diguanylate cyclase [Bradyrhizobium hipponense]|uniref:diguanylate cyclase n=1 Tax=Bradyrhizobium hipponense TaxID=2605638 RepID=A0A5S4YIM0_9BRAD|nr:diguanylate cyclase [Bradyrhizobium hipponense]TYO64256.1 diguanylate cyclase [Bradyrhizobium hipponense]
MATSALHQSIHRKPHVVVGTFLALMLACVLGLIVWKASVARDATLSRAQEDLKNLTRSLAEHAAHAFKAPDVAMAGMADLLKFQNPLPERFNAYLVAATRSMPQIREIGVLNTEGNWRYGSFAALPSHNSADRPYFAYHRDNPSPKMLISGPITLRTSGRPSIILSRRISTSSGDFGGVLIAAIDRDYFGEFYRAFEVGSHGGISLLSTDGTLLARWPVADTGQKIADTSLFQERLSKSRAGSYKVKSPFDGLSKYIAYEQSTEYPVVVTVARAEDDVLASWRTDLVSDALVAGLLAAIIVAIAALLSSQFRFRTRLEQSLREREARFRLLADNIADIVIVMDRKGYLRYVSPSVVTVLGKTEDDFLRRLCFEVVHEDDREKVLAAGSELQGPMASRSVRFRVQRGDGATAWLEANFKLAEISSGSELEIVGVLRDVTNQKVLEDELSSANLKLAQLATTDGLTMLANRRSFDAFLRQAYAEHEVVSVLLIDIDHFKGFNDALGHQAGDGCLQRIAELIGSATAKTGGLSARYGGEEFAVVLPGVDEERAARVADAIRLLVRRLEIYHPRSPRKYVAISVGVAAKGDATTDELALTRDADIALYHAKEQGRDCTVASSSLVSSRLEMPSLAPSLWDLEGAL